MSARTHKRIVIDLDNTLTQPGGPSSYADKLPNGPVVDRLREYKSQGFEIAIHTARNMRTYSGNVGKINAITLPVIIDWLARHEIPYDEIFVGKPWCGEAGFYVDDKSLRPDEFCRLSYDEVTRLLDLDPAA